MGDTYWMLVGGGGRGDMHVTVHGPHYGIRGSGDLINPRYEWSITFLFQFSKFAKTAFDWFEKSAKLAANWLETKPRAVSYGRIHVTNFKIL